ncbi:SurA N-terminal domain-containing protein [Methyloligella sp. 2.7D]|uniref:SurA N-terminal domain-containing protein n=1 Tax=unclassified Methyloligella TaxID=2625955 RepID=UPI00157D0AA9|nr:SurA N-terminal domain-containing protein [Methyloligella sp. GL2]QKP77473.1 SurA N-terminal domain-containing protein [Methyloligella sp. GL2]
MAALISSIVRTAARASLAAGIWLALSPAASLPAHAQVEQSIKVIVNDNPISAYDIEQRMRFLAVTSGEKPSAELQKKATEMLIDERLQIEAGKEQKLYADEGDVNRVVESMAQKNKLDAAGLAQALGKAGINVKTLKDRIRAQLVWQDVIRKKFSHTVTVGQRDIDAALAQSGTINLAQSTTLQLRRVSFSGGGGDAGIARRLAQAEDLRRRFRSCNTLPLIAKDFSGASVGGVSTTKASAVRQPQRAMLMHAEVNQMTAPSIASGRVELYALCGKDTKAEAPQERDTARRELMNKEMMDKADDYLAELRKEAFIERR